MSDQATRMRDAGRSWTEIADKLGVSVPEVKSRVAPDKQARRREMSHSLPAETRNGLRDRCTCMHMRKAHADFTGACRECGPVREVWEVHDYRGDEPKHYVVDQEPTPPEGTDVFEWSVYSDLKGCDEYTHPGTRLLPWRRVPELDPQHPEYVDPDIQLSKYVSRQAWQLGVERFRRGGNEPDIPHPSLNAQVRRARKRLKAGKKVKIKRARRW